MAQFIKSVTFASAGILSKSWMGGDYDPEKLLLEYQQEVEQVIEAVLNESPDLDLVLAQLVEDMPGDARVALVRKVQELIRQRDEQKAQALEAYLAQLEEQQKQRGKESQRQSWLAHFLSRETLRKMKEVFLSRPGLERQVQDIGQDLAAKGILQSLQLGDTKELGGMANNVSQVAPGFSKGKDGRGV